MEEKFNPAEHFIKLPKKKKNPKTGQWEAINTDYLEVKWRVVWFRQEHPEWGIETDGISITDQQAIFKAEIKNQDGRILATGYGSETPKDFGDYIEKAETKSIGRALAYLGYGTQFAPELDEGERIVDAPVERTKVPGDLITNSQKKTIGFILQKKKISAKDAKKTIKARYNKDDSGKLTKQEAGDLIEHLNTL